MIAESLITSGQIEKAELAGSRYLESSLGGVSQISAHVSGVFRDALY